MSTLRRSTDAGDPHDVAFVQRTLVRLPQLQAHLSGVPPAGFLSALMPNRHDTPAQRQDAFGLMNAMTFPVAVDRELVTRIQMEFMEMPGLCLSERQARRLWNIEEATCARILALLVEDRFLMRSRDGAYLRSGSRRLHNTDAA